MTINNILNFFSPQQDLQENGDEPGFISQTAVIGTLAAGVLVGFAQYGYSKYSAYRLRCQEYQDLCQGLDKWCQEAEPTEFESRSKAANRIKECYWKKNQTLDLSDFQLASLPPEIGQLTNLQELDLSRNCLQQLPQEIEQLTNLQKLNLFDNQFQEPYPEIQYDHQTYSAYCLRRQEYQVLCQGLDRWCNEAEPSELEERNYAATLIKECYWEKSKILHLSNSQLTSLPPEIGQLTNLQELKLSNNCLQQLPPEIGQLTNLQKLDLSNNRLQQLPPEVGQLTHLETLYLNKNRLQQLPPEIGQFTNLQVLTLSENRLQQLPPEFGQLTNLQELNLFNNRLQQLPSEIGQLTNLQTLDLAENPLQQLPQEILQLMNLLGLYLPDSTAQASQELVASLRNEGVDVDIRSVLPSQSSSSTLTLNLQQLQDDPISVLRVLQGLLQEDYSFPKIVYEDSDGADAGGLSRDLVTRLFQEIFDKENPQLPILELDDCFLPVVDSIFDYSESYQSQQLYQAIGMIFAAAARKGLRPIITGKYFHPILFEMLYCLSQEDISKFPDQFTTLSDLPEGIVKKLLSFHLYSKVDGSDDQKKESASLLAKAFIENQFPDSFGIYESREEFLKAYPYADKIMLVAPGTLAIAQGMHNFLENWELNADSAVDLQLNIEGYFSREDVENILSWQEGENSLQNQQTKEFLLQWIRDETTPLKTISQFLFAGTGSSTIMKGKNLHVSFYSAEGPEEGLEWFPKYHACSFAMEIPRNYPDYVTFKRMLEGSIRAAHFGFQTR